MHNFPIVVSSRMVAVSRHQYQLRAVPLFKPPNVFFTYLHPPVGVSWLDYPTLPKKASRQGTPWRVLVSLHIFTIIQYDSHLFGVRQN